MMSSMNIKILTLSAVFSLQSSTASDHDPGSGHMSGSETASNVSPHDFTDVQIFEYDVRLPDSEIRTESEDFKRTATPLSTMVYTPTGNDREHFTVSPGEVKIIAPDVLTGSTSEDYELFPREVQFDALTVVTEDNSQRTTQPDNEIQFNSSHVMRGNNKTVDVPTPPVLQAGFFSVPILLVVGLFGNVMSIIVMTRREFKKTTMNIIIIALAVSDTILILLQPHNKPYVHSLLTTDIRSYNTVTCKAFFWLFRTAKMTSSWLIVLISAERLVAVFFPLRAKLINSKRNITIGVCLVYLIIGGFDAVWVVYSDILVAGQCVPNKSPPQMAHVARGFSLTGTTIVLFIPGCLIFTMNIMIVVRMTLQMKKRSTMASSTTLTKHQEQQTKLTAMLLGISFCFLVLVTPAAILHLLATFSGFNPFMATDATMKIVIEVVMTLEQLNYSTNFYLYVLSSGPFRAALRRLFGCSRADKISGSRSSAIPNSRRCTESSRLSDQEDRKVVDLSVVSENQIQTAKRQDSSGRREESICTNMSSVDTSDPPISEPIRGSGDNCQPINKQTAPDYLEESGASVSASVVECNVLDNIVVTTE